MAHFKEVGLLVFVILVHCLYTTMGRETQEWKIEDILKGKGGKDLIRSKRYIGRVPVAYMKKVNYQPYQEEEAEGGAAIPPASHFREILQKSGGAGEGGQPQQLPHHNNIRRYIPPYDEETAKLTDEEIQTLLLFLDGYNLAQNNPPHSRISPKIAQMYETGRKRETGKRSVGEIPMSFDNSFYPQEEELEFLSDVGTRNKRTGARHLLVSSRVKKETKAPASLDKLFSGEKSKKSIDWSNYFGVDKRNSKPTELPSPSPSSNSNPKPPPPPTNPITKSTSPTKSTTKKEEKVNDKKENETVNKNGVDREWMLQEFYKNFAMMTNVRKRKREIQSIEQPTNEIAQLAKLEQEMTQVGDKIIWDTLKYTGAHRDVVENSPPQLAKLKAKVINQLATAYSLEKVREAVDDLRHKLETFKKE